MKILLSNDDGIYAPGLDALANAMKQIASIHVVAPDRNRSGASNSLTLNNPLRVKQISSNYISVEGTPTDCVHLAITGLLNDQPDMVVSGVNCGANLGDDILYSGTVAAAMEGRYLGYPAIAISLAGRECNHYATAAEVAKQLVEHILANPLPAKTILNVNVPDIPISELRGFEVTRLGTRHRAEQTIKMSDPRGQEIFWVGPPGNEQDAGIGTDFYAINNNKVSITPLQLDMTHYKAFDDLSTWIDELIL